MISEQRRSQLRKDVTAILHDQLQWEGTFPDGGLEQHLDSMQRMAFVIAIEDHYEICFEPEDEQSIRSFDDLLGCVAGKLEARQ
jgi:acyl carrier protein